RLTSALQLIEQAAAVLVAVSLSAEEMDAADVVDAIKACSSLVTRVGHLDDAYIRCGKPVGVTLYQLTRQQYKEFSEC
uniref:DUF2824 family protein n=1 Tax=Escherichia coli TaxID=562 RepID=UPI00155F62F6